MRLAERAQSGPNTHSVGESMPKLCPSLRSIERRFDVDHLLLSGPESAEAGRCVLRAGAG